MDSQKQGCEYQRYDGHKLNEDVEGWATCVLQWISNCIAHHSCLVYIAVLSLLMAMLIVEVSSFDVLLSVIPGTTRVS